MAPLRGLRRHPGRGALLPLSPRRAPRPRAVAAGEEDPRVGGRLRLDRPPHEPSDRTLSWERRPRPVRQGARQGRAEIRRQSGGREDVPRLRLPAHPQRAVPEGLHPHREPGRRDRRARAPEQAPHRRLFPLEVQGRRSRVLSHRRVHGRMEDLADRSATELARLVASREVSPVEVVEACLERVERYNPAVNAVVTLNPRALDDAGELELRLVRSEEVGLLAGLPVGIKDVTPVAGLRTTYGSPLYRDHVPTEDALVVQRLRAAGAIILGKTNCPEFAAGGNTFNEVFGRTRNPWDPTRSAGGSTGCAAAPRSGSASSAWKSRRSISTCRSGERRSSHCGGCGSSRRCSRGWSSSTGSEPMSQGTFAPGSTRPPATSAPRKRRAVACGTCFASSSGSSTTCSRRAWRSRRFRWTRTILKPWPAGKWTRTWIGLRPRSC